MRIRKRENKGPNEKTKIKKEKQKNEKIEVKTTKNFVYLIKMKERKIMEKKKKDEKK